MARNHIDRIRKLGLTLPGVEEGTSYGTMALKVRKKLLCRMKEDGETMVFPCSGLDEKEFLMQTEPEIFFETDHYKGWASVLVRLSQLQDKHLFELIEQAWRRLAGPKLIAAREQQRS